jgi:hypothetical protein
MMPAGAASPPELGGDGRIIEGVVTTLNADGDVHISPMGPLVGDRMDWLWLRPFRTSITFRNLVRQPAGVFHVTDDVQLLAEAAIGQPHPTPPTVRADKVNGAILADACRWYAFLIEWIDDSTDRATALARVVDAGVRREFFGFNRAKHAVVEAAILATRVHLVDQREILAEFERLATPVAKTGAAEERTAFDLLRRHVLDHAAAVGLTPPSAAI